MKDPEDSLVISQKKVQQHYHRGTIVEKWERKTRGSPSSLANEQWKERRNQGFGAGGYLDLAPGKSLSKALKILRIDNRRDAEISWVKLSSQQVNLPSALPLMKPLWNCSLNGRLELYSSSEQSDAEAKASSLDHHANTVISQSFIYYFCFVFIWRCCTILIDRKRQLNSDWMDTQDGGWLHWYRNQPLVKQTTWTSTHEVLKQKTLGVSLRAGNQANWPAVRTALPGWFQHLFNYRFLKFLRLCI